jgi:hypothetical protein
LSPIPSCHPRCIATNFTVVDTVYDPLTEAYGYVGYNTVNNTIVIGFRGSSNDANWVDDFDIILGRVSECFW